MGIESRVGNFFFRSRFSEWLWNFSTSSPFQVIRITGAVLISVLLVARAANLFLYTKLTSKPLLGFLVVSFVWAGPAKTFSAASIVGLGYLFWQHIKQPNINAGHRAGGKGFKGALPENTLQALRHLIALDRKGEVKDFYYVEFDVHETKDGELIILHDLSSFLAASKDSPLNAKIMNDILKSGINLDHADVKDLTAAQIQSIHIGGVKDVHAPTVAEFLSYCRKEGLERSLAAEVKSILTDEGRRKFLDLLSQYRREYCLGLERRCPQKKYLPFDWVAAIAFPFTWAPSFGEFCNAEWKLWADRFRAEAIPVRSCVLHSLDLVPPTRLIRRHSQLLVKESLQEV